MKTDKRQRLMMILAVALLAVLVADRLVFEPLVKVWMARAGRIAMLRKDVADGALLLQREKSLRTRWHQMRANTLPENSSLAEQRLLKGVNTWAQETGASITSIAPQWKHDADEYMTLVCRIDATGDLNAVIRLLYDVERSPMALKLESMELTASDAAGQELALGMRLSGLVLTPDGQRR